jgi:hypothetical protein
VHRAREVATLSRFALWVPKPGMTGSDQAMRALSEELLVTFLLQSFKGGKSQLAMGKCPEFFAHSIWAERRPALAQAVMAAFICWSFSGPMFK